ncbi:MAG: hypothetical protein GY814_07070 [Gammaproteobacteria bacterium]|nr:hypothetical protein [Gammaproteobacteria bacterium]
MLIIRISTADAPRRFWLVAAIVCCSVVSGQAAAEKWYFEPVVSMRIGYNDNTQLKTDSEIETTASYITGYAAFGFRTEVSDVSLTAKMIDRRFDNYKDLNTNDQFIKLKSSVRSGQNRFGLGADYQRESTRTSEFDYSGYSSTNKIKITKSVSPYWSRALTERTSLQLGGDYTDVVYEDAELTGLSDYTNKSIYASMQHSLSERTMLQAVASKSLYSSDSTEFDSTSVQVGFDYRLSETFSVDLLLGPKYIKSEYVGSSGKESSSDVGRLIDIGFRKEFELTTVNGSIATSESAGGGGKMTRSTSLNLSLQHKLSARSTFNLSGTTQQNEAGGGSDDSSLDRTYFSVEPKLSWKASPWWTVTGSYRYRRSEYTSLDDGAAESNALYLTLMYVWPKESLGRWMDL